MAKLQTNERNLLMIKSGVDVMKLDFITGSFELHVEHCLKFPVIISVSLCELVACIFLLPHKDLSSHYTYFIMSL